MSISITNLIISSFLICKFLLDKKKNIRSDKKLEELKIKKLQDKIDVLKEVAEHNAKKVETRGRKLKLDKPLTEHMAFVCTKKQRIKLKVTLRKANVDLSTFIRGLIFGDE